MTLLNSPYIPPRLTLRVGVTGHRPNKLEGVDTARLRERAATVLTSLASVTQSLQSDNDARGDNAPFTRDAPELRLATAIAEGADRIVAEAALAAGYGLNLFLPFPRTRYAKDFEGAALAEFQRLLDHDAVQSCTELNLGETPHGPEDGYLAAGHLTISHSDVVIAIWDGEDADGLGGTAEIVTEARRRGLITVLITLGGEIKLWTLPDTVTDPLADGDWQTLELADEAVSSNTLAELVKKQLTPPDLMQAEQEALSPEDGLRRFQRERLHPYGWASGYNLLRWVFLPGRRYSLRVDNGLERERREAWAETSKAAEAIGGATFRDDLDTQLRERWLGADNLAVHYSHRFRSAYVTNFILAALAVFTGLLAVLCWESKAAKAIFVLAELTIIGIILTTTWLGRRGRWRDRWLDYRSLAEALRPARLPMLIGSSPVRPVNDLGSTPGQAWIAWYVRASLREIIPPTAVISADELKTTIDVTLSEEVEGQLAYHRQNARLLHQLDHRLEMAAEVAFWATVGSGVLYLIAYGLYAQGWHQPAEDYKPFATLLGATLPVLGAAIFGIRATGDFRSAIQQSRRMVSELEQLHTQLTVQQEEPDRRAVRRLLAQVSLTLSDDLRVWSMIYSERELIPGF